MRFLNWSTIDYEKAEKDQETLVAERALRKIEDTIIFCTHPPVVTLGRKSKKEEDVKGWSGKIVSSSRGGKATYHGPNQILIYLILSLFQERKNFPSKDIKAYLNGLERCVVKSLREISVLASVSEGSFYDNEKNERDIRGIWVKDKKIASIGISIKNWVTYHGVAINWDKDEKAFQGISPCGWTPDIMTSVEKVLGEKKDRKEFLEILERNLSEGLS